MRLSYVPRPQRGFTLAMWFMLEEVKSSRCMSVCRHVYKDPRLIHHPHAHSHTQLPTSIPTTAATPSSAFASQPAPSSSSITLFRFQNASGAAATRGGISGGRGRGAEAGAVEATLQDWGEGKWQFVYRCVFFDFILFFLIFLVVC